MRLAHSMADTLITPLNDSFVDFDVLGTVDPVTFAVTGTSHFADMVRDGRRHRRVVDPCGHRLDRGAQPSVHAQFAQQALGGRGAESCTAPWLSRRGWLCRARDLPRILSTRTDGARRSRRDHTGYAPEPVARDRTAGGRGLLKALQLPLDERGLTARRSPGGMVRGRQIRWRCTTSSPE